MKRRELRNARRFFAQQRMLYCFRDGCAGDLEVVGGADDRAHLVCPTCGWTSAGPQLITAPFAPGDRLRVQGYGIEGAGTVGAVETVKDEMIVHVLFDKGGPPEPHYAVHIDVDGTVKVPARYLERLSH